MGRPDRMVIAHDLPMRLSDAADELAKLDGDWYFARDPAAQIEELLAFGKVFVERETPGRVYAHLEREGGGMVTATDATVSGALLKVYNQLEDR